MVILSNVVLHEQNDRDKPGKKKHGKKFFVTDTVDENYVQCLLAIKLSAAAIVQI